MVLMLLCRLHALPFEGLYSTLTISNKNDFQQLKDIFAAPDFLQKGFNVTKEGSIYIRSMYRYKR